jgi:hypothetical protein
VGFIENNYTRFFATGQTFAGVTRRFLKPEEIPPDKRIENDGLDAKENASDQSHAMCPPGLGWLNLQQGDE